MPETQLSAETQERARKLFAGPCDFVAGAAQIDMIPLPDAPEVAFAGRSNVGKSSLINALTGRKSLARTSNTPGRTQQINFFSLGGRLCLVDMPGYGHAQVSRGQKEEWRALIHHYLRERASLRCVFLLVDSRHGLKDSDEEMMDILDSVAAPYRVVLTKMDRAENTAEIVSRTREALQKHTAAFPEPVVTSSYEGHGIADLRSTIFALAADES